MRHFLPPSLTIGSLARGMVARSAQRLLVAPARSTKCLPTANRRALRRAVDLPAVARPADPDRLAAPLAAEQPVTLDDARCPSRPKAGQRSPIRSSSGRRRVKLFSTKRCSKARGCRPEPSPFSAAAARYTNALRLATSRPESHPRRPRGREGDDPLAAPPGIKTPSAQNPMKKSGDNTRHSPDLRGSQTPSTGRKH